MKTLNATKPNFRILQLTDLHYMHQGSDEQTNTLIRLMVKKHQPDLIVITGDLTMCHDNQDLLMTIRDLVTSCAVPWTFTFGNHDHEALLSLSEQADILMKSPLCLFEKGDESLDGCGNHFIKVNLSLHTYLLGLLDSHNDRIDRVNDRDVWSYDYLKASQIDYSYQTILIENDRHSNLSSLFFFHIPLIDFKTKLEEDQDGISGECHESISSSRIESHFFDRIVQTKTLKGIFVGHDHVNDYSFEKGGCLFAFGRCTGHYNYTMPEFKKGVRIIDLHDNGTISSFVDSE